MKKLIRKWLGIDPDLSDKPSIGEIRLKTVSNFESPMLTECKEYKSPTNN